VQAEKTDIVVMDIHARIYNKYTFFSYSSTTSLCLNTAHTAAWILDRYIRRTMGVRSEYQISSFLCLRISLRLQHSISFSPWIRIDRNGELRADILNEIFQWYSLAAVIISYIHITIHTAGTYIQNDQVWHEVIASVSRSFTYTCLYYAIYYIKLILKIVLHIIMLYIYNTILTILTHQWIRINYDNQSRAHTYHNMYIKDPPSLYIEHNIYILYTYTIWNKCIDAIHCNRIPVNIQIMLFCYLRIDYKEFWTWIEFVAVYYNIIIFIVNNFQARWKWAIYTIIQSQ